MTVQTFPAAPTSALPEADVFLAPISEDRPAGEWLRFDSLYDEVKLLRAEDDASLPQGVWQRELKKADWSGVSRLCQNALETRTKDLQIAAWMTEAWMNLHGFRGFERGVRVTSALCRTFWDSVYPALEDGSIEPRLAPIVWMTEKLVLPLKSIPITAPTGETSMAYAWRDWESAQYLAKTTKGNATAIANLPEKSVTQSKFMVAVSLTPALRFVELEFDLGAALAALDDLDAALGQHLTETQAPSLTAMRAPLQAMLAFVSRIRAERTEKGEIPPAVLTSAVIEEVPMSTEEVPAAPTMPISSGGPITNRAEAYHRLREASDYLMRTEPHSPVPYLVRRAISWGNLSLAELLEELLQKNADLATINSLLGIRKS